MGCDIHMYVEYKIDSDDESWMNFGSEINPGRNYYLFGLLAGVRCDFEESLEPKGLPEKTGLLTKWDNELYIVEEEKDTEGCCTLKEAENWEKYGCSKIMYNKEGNPYSVTHPDWHSHSWLSVEEFKTVLSIHNNIEDNFPDAPYEALLSAMQKLSDFYEEVRIVFWFDN